MAEDNEKVLEAGENEASGSNRFLMFLFLGLTLVFVGMIVIFAATAFSGGVASFGGFIFIGPFPIVIGVGPDWNLLVIIGLAIAALSIGVFVIMRRRI